MMRRCSGALSHDSMPEDYTPLFGLSGHACQPADDLRLPLGVVPQVTSIEEREQDDSDVQRARQSMLSLTHCSVRGSDL